MSTEIFVEIFDWSEEGRKCDCKHYFEFESSNIARKLLNNRGKVVDELITSVFGHSAAYEKCCVHFLCSLKEGTQDTQVYIGLRYDRLLHQLPGGQVICVHTGALSCTKIHKGAQNDSF